MPGESKTSPRRIEAKEKQRQALELRKAGATYDGIARQIGYKSKQAAEYAVKAALSRITDPIAAEVLKIDLERLDQWLLAMAPKLRLGDPFTVQIALNIIARRAKLLGLDSPIKVDSKSEVEIKDKRDLSGASEEDLKQALAEVERILGHKAT